MNEIFLKTLRENDKLLAKIVFAIAILIGYIMIVNDYNIGWLTLLQ